MPRAIRAAAPAASTSTSHMIRQWPKSAVNSAASTAAHTATAIFVGDCRALIIAHSIDNKATTIDTRPSRAAVQKVPDINSTSSAAGARISADRARVPRLAQLNRLAGGEGVI